MHQILFTFLQDLTPAQAEEWAKLLEENERLNEQVTDQVDLVIYGSLIPLVIVFVFLFFVVYRSRREATFRKREFELELSKSSMEMRALRSQVNPHFIFNCLASIQHFISKNDNKQAEYYLVRFSRLIRQVLENSTQNMVALAEDLEALEMYVEMERLRLQNQFDFHLKIDDSIDTEEVFIPPLIIQPLVENAIWHGVGAEGEKTQITVEIKPGEKQLECIVENPLQETGMKKVSYKRKSLGLALIKERLELLNGIYDTDCSLSQEDVGYISKRTKIEIPIERE